jgi:nuclear transport factor 2 (NTF2) superfamily protein
VEFLKRKWAREIDYRLIKQLWAHHVRGFEPRLYERLQLLLAQHRINSVCGAAA